ncbi:PREDICTED: protein psiS-like [Branchiostoma belcheri]|uniref:Protein psiS-like n=1 Tax=Branchiostoma belcheri TaxID=7741 RepID=A0A6P4ZVC3_BRABE|nr:PREDICTED: protein psiS-like [Branchiostoma belcheri]
MYTCTVLYNNMGDFSASSWPVTVTTLQETEEIDVNSMQVPISYYDFSITHPDFDGRRQGDLSDPTYVVNPFGGYLSMSDDPTLDSFARWFLSVPGDNYIREKTLVLKQQNGTNTYRYTNDDFFPVDGFGYGFEGQRDCNGTLHNFGFTAAIRAALTYRGNEIITVGGGDELWLFIDRERVIDLRREKGDKSETTSCRRLKLQDSRSEGGVSAVLVPGTVTDGECVIHGNVTNDTAKLDLTTGNAYHLDIFVAEREPCTSSLFLEVQGVVLSFPVVDLSADVGSVFTARALNVSNGTTDSPTVTPEESNNINTF